MPSPFPGMNPYLEHETVFHDFHNSFAFVARKQIHRQLPERYFARTDMEVYLHEPPATTRGYVRPDVFVSTDLQASTTNRGAHQQAPTTALAVLSIDEIKLPSIHIVDKESNRLVTAIELLSPTNKIDPTHRAQYLLKRQRYLDAEVSLVEIDLLRAGPRMPLDPIPACDYLVSVMRAYEKPRAGLWPIALRERLPVVPVPLLINDDDASLDLQGVIDEVYDSAGYDRTIYRHALNPPLATEDLRWAEQQVRG